jgi:serine-type D-Ala-D-Ala carboxypeptidase/endopeptidase (penicillin-binding protein 4)
MKTGRSICRILGCVLLVQAALPGPAPATVGRRVARVSQTGAPSADDLESLRARIAEHINQPRFAPAAWGIKVLSLDTGKIIFEHNADKYFNPASNAKLYTVALALDRLGPDFRIKTSLYSTVRPDSGGTLKGDLIVYGRGDPTIAARLNDGDYFKALGPLATALINAGVRRIEGDLIGDESYFTGPPLGSGWDWEDLQWYYGAEVSSLSINDNSVDLFVKPAERVGMPCRVSTGPSTSFVTLINRIQTAARGEEPRVSVYRPVGENIIYVSGKLPIGGRGYSGSVAVHNPAGLFAALFRDFLTSKGVAVVGRPRSVDWKYREVAPLDFSKLFELGSIESRPLGDIVRETLKPSQNLYAQLLLLQVGANRPATDQAKTGDSGTGGAGRATEEAYSFATTEQAGVEALNVFLSELGIKRGDVVLEEGSGLSRRDMVTPASTVELLTFMSRHRLADIYMEALPVAGADGTLQNRMRGTRAANNLRAKTGSLRYVYALSGYVRTRGGERLAFSIMLNNYYTSDRSPFSARDDIDTLAVLLSDFRGKSE